tara:strand:- start:5785 stop:6168 length:384 start_codon:yes stop_codon:yes gene_type:complete
MANSYSWTVEKVYTKNITTGGKTYSSVIARVEATLKATSGSDSSISTDHFVDLDMNTTGLASSFTAYADVSEANVKTWIESRLNATTLASIKSHMDNEITFLENVNGATAQGSTDSEGNFTASFPWS